ncbi:MAG: hypothetical protein ACM3SY_12125 [Candidatus Omnitrophota bacterium]
MNGDSSQQNGNNSNSKKNDEKKGPKTPEEVEKEKEKEHAKEVRKIGVFLIGTFLGLILFIYLLWPSKSSQEGLNNGGQNTSNAAQFSAEMQSTAKTDANLIHRAEWKDPNDNAGQNASNPTNVSANTQPTTKKDDDSTDTTNTDTNNCKNLFGLRVLGLVLVFGALGSFIHVASSFIYYIGNKDYKKEFKWWYFLRIPIGAALALIFCAIIEGGMFHVPPRGTESQLFVLIGLAGLIGMFSRQAGEKLSDIFDVVFQSKETGSRLKNKFGTGDGNLQSGMDTPTSNAEQKSAEVNKDAVPGI